MSKAIQTAVVTVISNRSVEVIASEINTYKSQAYKMLIDISIEIGRRLVEAKECVPHGEWGNWLQESVDFSQSTANNHMKMFTEYGSKQLSLFGDNAKSQTIGKLSYSQAVALLAIPSEERETFVEENDVESKSISELKKAIKDKQEADRLLKESVEREQAAKQARELVSTRLTEVEDEALVAAQEIERLNEVIKTAESSKDTKTANAAKTEIRKAEKAASDAQKLSEDLKKQLEDQKNAQEKAISDRLQQREQELYLESKKREDGLQEQLSKLEQQLKRSNNESFLKAKMQLQQIITQGDVLVKAIAEVTDPEEQVKLKAAAVQVVDKLRALL